MVGDLDSFGFDLLVRLRSWKAIMIVKLRVQYGARQYGMEDLIVRCGLEDRNHFLAAFRFGTCIGVMFDVYEEC